MSETDGIKKYQILDGTMLKIIAMLSMVFDHAGDIFFPGVMWPRMVGRLAMPLFSFCIAEGYSHTSNKLRYLMRIGLFALISEIPFDLAFEKKINLTHQSIMLTFFISVLALMIYDRITDEKYRQEKTYSIRIILGVLVILAAAVLALLLKADYTIFAVIAVFLFYVFRHKKHVIRCAIGTGFLALTRTKGFYCVTGLSLIPLLMYNGKRGKGLKWLFYLFYPGHLLILYVLRLLLKI